jgi:hypothetical protein
MLVYCFRVPLKKGEEILEIFSIPKLNIYLCYTNIIDVDYCILVIRGIEFPEFIKKFNHPAFQLSVLRGKQGMLPLQCQRQVCDFRKEGS